MMSRGPTAWRRHRLVLAVLVLFAVAACAALPPAPASTSGAGVAGSSPAPRLAVGISDEEFIGPFDSWIDVKSRLGAVGDGKADDTAAIQRGLDQLHRYDSKQEPATLYFPAGRYRITRTLSMRLNVGAGLVGADPARTYIVWDGEPGGTMLLTSGSFDTLFSRLTWDGAGKARIGVAQWWNFRLDRANYQGSIKHMDETFRGLDIGIAGGRLGKDYGEGDSETWIERVRFIGNRYAGVDVGSFNALNWWIWDSQFLDCGRGVTNQWSLDDSGETGGAGTFMVYRSEFRGSSVADIAIGNTGWFGFYRNLSVGSNQFLRAAAMGASGGPIWMDGNTVLDTIDPVSVQVGNEGPLMLIDNRIRSREVTSGPVILMEGLGSIGDRDLISLGNAFTRDAPLGYRGTTGRTLSDDRVLDRAAIPEPAWPAPTAAIDRHRRVFDVHAGAEIGQIQAAIDAAVASGEENAVVHLAPGDYQVSRTLVIPARVRVQLAGDSEATKLWWSGPAHAGPVIRLEGPSYATLREIGLIGHDVTGIEIDGADQPGGRVFIEGSSLGPVEATGLRQTRVDAQANSGIAGLTARASSSLLAIGGFGPVHSTERSNVIETDNWYEGSESALFRGDSGTFTYLGGEMAPFSHGVGAGRDPDEPAVFFDGFDGHASFIGATMSLPRASNGIVVRRMNRSAQVLFLGTTGTRPGYFSVPPSERGVGLAYGKVYSPDLGARGIPDTGRSDPTFISDGLRQARSVVWDLPPHVHVDEATDVRLFRVFTDNTRVGLRVRK